MTLAAIEYGITSAVFVTPRGVPVTMWCRTDTSDWNSTHSCLNADEYGIRGRHLEGVALDIGAYTGAFSIGLAVDNPGLRVIAVEPIPENADLIERNAHDNDVAVEVFRGSVGPKGTTQSEIRFRYVGDFSLEHHAFVGNTSLAYPDAGSVQHDALTVETLGLAALLARYDIDEPSFVKIDCEGGEWPFFETATQAALKRLPLIVGEAHAVGTHKGKDILAVLGKTHEVTLSGNGEGTCEFTAVRR